MLGVSTPSSVPCGFLGILFFLLILWVKYVETINASALKIQTVYWTLEYACKQVGFRSNRKRKRTIDNIWHLAEILSYRTAKAMSSSMRFSSFLIISYEWSFLLNSIPRIKQLFLLIIWWWVLHEITFFSFFFLAPSFLISIDLFCVFFGHKRSICFNDL